MCETRHDHARAESRTVSLPRRFPLLTAQHAPSICPLSKTRGSYERRGARAIGVESSVVPITNAHQSGVYRPPASSHNNPSNALARSRHEQMLVLLPGNDPSNGIRIVQPPEASALW